jgi:hypothetical protein
LAILNMKISKFKVFGLEIGVLNTFKIKSDEHKVCVGQLFKYLNMTTIISHNKVVTSVTKNKPAAVSWRCTICDEISCLYVTTKPSRHKIKWLSSNYDDTKIFVIVCYII